MFLKLRGRMKELGMEQEYLAKKLGICIASLSRRLNGHKQWLMSEMYAAMDILLLPHESLHEYFPKGGKSQTYAAMCSIMGKTLPGQ